MAPREQERLSFVSSIPFNLENIYLFFSLGGLIHSIVLIWWWERSGVKMAS